MQPKMNNLWKKNIEENRIIVQKKEFSMKKMLSTLTAIVLSVAVVSTVEAKKVGGSATPAQVEKDVKMNQAAQKPIPAAASESTVVRQVNRKVDAIQKIEQDLRNMQS